MVGCTVNAVLRKSDRESIRRKSKEGRDRKERVKELGRKRQRKSEREREREYEEE